MGTFRRDASFDFPMLQDLRYALRMIRQQPWFSAAIIGTLAFPGSDRIVMAPASARPGPR